ncbi:MAG: heavy metal-binding domain-containing protein [Planctomycetota bacterium]|jgi:uncharacterized protein YbjQ (UPF0145 family)|nr:heavy metal-binding domain-containing protein [Planctomycetota bacterium]
MDLLINIALFLTPIGLGLFIGGRREKNHFQSLALRRAALQDILISDIRTFPGGSSLSAPPKMLTSQVVIATDYFKSFLAGLSKLFGGEIRSYESLLTRAREEAITRLIEEAHVEGYDAICNLRVDTADIGGGAGSKGVVTVGIMATATAYRRIQ